MAEPYLVSSPYVTKRWGQISDASVSLLDIVPTILDWFSIDYPSYKLFGTHDVQLTGKSVLPMLKEEPVSGWDPMRVMQKNNLKLIHNLWYKMPYPIALDIFTSFTFRDILERTRNGTETGWIHTLKQYYYRAQWELYDLKSDPKELKTLINNPGYQAEVKELRQELLTWQRSTDDPWLCSPGGSKWGACVFQWTMMPDWRD